MSHLYFMFSSSLNIFFNQSGLITIFKNRKISTTKFGIVQDINACGIKIATNELNKESCYCSILIFKLNFRYKRK